MFLNKTYLQCTINFIELQNKNKRSAKFKTIDENIQI